MGNAFLFGFILVALGFAAGTLTRLPSSRGSTAESAPRGGLRDVPALLIGTGAVILGGGLTLWLGESVLALADAASFDLSSLTRGPAPVALGAVAVGLAAGFAAPGVGRWTWGLLASLFPWLLTGTLWVLFVVVPEGFEAAETFAQEQAIEASEVRRSIFRLLAIVTAYPVLALLCATGGATLARALPPERRRAASVQDRPPAPGVVDEDEGVGPDESFGGHEELGAERKEVAIFRFERVGESWCHRVFDGSEELAFLDIRPGAREGGFELEGSYYKIVADLLGRSHTLEWRGRPLARADSGLLRRSSRILVGDRELSLRPRFALAPVLGTLFLEESGRRTGRVEPRPAHGEGGVAELPPDLPLPVRLFVIYAALVILMRWRVSEV